MAVEVANGCGGVSELFVQGVLAVCVCMYVRGVCVCARACARAWNANHDEAQRRSLLFFLPPLSPPSPLSLVYGCLSWAGQVLIDDGLISLTVVEKQGENIKCRVSI